MYNIINEFGWIKFGISVSHYFTTVILFIRNKMFCKGKKNNFDMTLLISYKERGRNEIELRTNETLRSEYQISCNQIYNVTI